MTDLSKLSDRELLELAAEAGGVEVAAWNDGAECYSSGCGFILESNAIWNSLKNAGDALRLTVKLRIFLDQEKIDKFAHLFGGAMTDHDEVPATCRAITLAAAAIALAKRAA